MCPWGLFCLSLISGGLSREVNVPLYSGVLLELIVSWNHVLYAAFRSDEQRDPQRLDCGRLLLSPSLLPQLFGLELLFVDGTIWFR